MRAKLSENHTGLDQRDSGLDVVRIVAALMVVVVHGASEAFYNLDDGWWVANVFESLSRSCVPLFFMLSGALMVPKKSDAPAVVRRIWRYVVPTFFWSAVYVIWFAWAAIPGQRPFGYSGPMPMPPTFSIEMLAAILGGWVVFHFWYLYTLLGIYLFMPVLQGFFQLSTAGTRALYVGAWFLGACLMPFFGDFGIQVPFGINLTNFPLYAGYVFLGGMLASTTVSKKIGIVLIGLYMISSAVIGSLTFHISWGQPEPLQTFYDYDIPMVAISAVALFLVLRSTFANLQGSARTIVRVLAEASFGVYILHFLVLRYVDNHTPQIDDWHRLISIPFAVLSTYVVSATITIIVRRLPFGRFLIPG